MAQAFKKMPALRIASVGALADAVAAAYGLESSHKDLAVQAEAEIATKIESKLSALMKTPAAPRPPADASDSFFGESDALGAVPGAAGAVAPPASTGMPSLSAAGIPKAAPSWLMLAIVGGGALMLGIVIVRDFSPALSRAGVARGLAAPLLVDHEGMSTAPVRSRAAVGGRCSAFILQARGPTGRRGRARPHGRDRAAEGRRPATTPAALASVPAPAEPAAADGAAASRYNEAKFDLTAQPSGAYAAGQEGAVEIVLNAKPPFHANQQYPYKFKAKEASAA